MNSSSINNINFFKEREDTLTNIKKYVMELSIIYGKSLKIEINVNSKVNNCSINIQENNL
jgi:hypothetical protein